MENSSEWFDKEAGIKMSDCVTIHTDDNTIIFPPGTEATILSKEEK